MAITWMIVAGILGGATNFCIRRNLDYHTSARVYYIVQLLLTFLVTLALHPYRSGDFNCNIPTFVFGVGAGLSLGFMKFMIEKAIKIGPSGLTFATVNSASVTPTFLIVASAGSLIDYHISRYDVAGSALIVLGLIWAGWDKSNHKCHYSWSIFAALGFLCYVAFLLFTEFRSLIISEQINPNLSPSYFNLNFTNELKSEWFGPIIFGTAAGLHLFLFLKNERRRPKRLEISWGILGGILNGLCMFFFIRATEIATIKESAYLFSIFSIVLIIACNVWGERYYNEKINWKANALCLLGIFIAAH